MSSVLVVATLQKQSQIPEDAVQNAFAFTSLLSNSEVGPEAADAVRRLYNQSGSGQTLPVCDWMAESLTTATGANRFDVYNLSGHLDGTPHGPPIYTESWELASHDSTSLPNEVASCLSFHSDYGTDVEFGAGSTRPRARDRGRVYIGPLGVSVIDTDVDTDEVFLKGDFCSDLASAAERELLGDSDMVWCVWSRSRAALEPVVSCWVDDAFDIQRRRGNAPRGRTTRP